jgi:hypothetical protein
MTAVTQFLPSALAHGGAPRTPIDNRFDRARTSCPRTSSEGLR